MDIYISIKQSKKGETMKKLLWLSMLSVLALTNVQVNAEPGRVLMGNGGKAACGIVEGKTYEVPATTIICEDCPVCEKWELIPEQVNVIPATFSAERVEVIPAQMRSVCPAPMRQRCHTRCHSCHRAKAACSSCQRRVHHARENGYQIVEGYEGMQG